jgi:hypothetical protein
MPGARNYLSQFHLVKKVKNFYVRKLRQPL